MCTLAAKVVCRGQHAVGERDARSVRRERRGFLVYTIVPAFQAEDTSIRGMDCTSYIRVVKDTYQTILVSYRDDGAAYYPG